MLVTFTSENHGDVLMFGDVATQLIRLMGHSGTIPGAIDAKDVPEALARLKKATEKSKKNNPDKPASNIDDEPRMTLAVRAFPLIEMLTAAAEAECSIMWYKK